MKNDIHGTLCISLPCKDGLVICADKRRSKLEQVVGDDATKVQQLGQKAAFIVTNLIRADGVGDNVVAFEPIKTVKTFLKAKNLNYLEKHKRELADALGRAIDTTFRTRCNILPGNIERAQSQVIVWHLDAYNQINCFRIAVEFDESRAPRATAQVSEPPTFKVQPSLAGHCDPFQAIHSGHFAELAALKADSRFQAMSAHPDSWKQADHQRACEIGKFVIKASSQAQAVATPQELSISETSDCCLLDYKSGFRWLSC